MITFQHFSGLKKPILKGFPQVWNHWKYNSTMIPFIVINIRTLLVIMSFEKMAKEATTFKYETELKIKTFMFHNSCKNSRLINLNSMTFQLVPTRVHVFQWHPDLEISTFKIKELASRYKSCWLQQKAELINLLCILNTVKQVQIRHKIMTLYYTYSKFSSLVIMPACVKWAPQSNVY